jgi:DNA primase
VERRAPLRRPLAPTATTLDHAVRLLVHRSDLWESLGPAAHDLLTEQPAPYGEFFAWIDRLVHDQGALAAAAVLDQLAGEPEPLGTLAQEIRRRIDIPFGDEARHEIDGLLDRLRLDAVNAEMKLLSETEGLSDDAVRRATELHAVRSELKSRLADTGHRL